MREYVPADEQELSAPPLPRPGNLWSLGGLSVGQLCVQSVRGFREHNLGARGAQFAYYSMLALAPLLMLVIAAVAQLPLEGLLDRFLEAIDAGLPHDVYQLIRRQVTDIQQQSTFGLVSVSLLVLAIAGSRLFVTMGSGLDAAYGVKEKRRFWISYGLGLLLTFGVFLLLLVAMVLLVIGPVVTGWLTARIDLPILRVLLSSGVRWGVAIAFLLTATSAIYCLIPTVKLPWYWLSPGSLFSTAGWIVVSQAFRLYVENFASYNETYGALGGMIVTMIWFYLTGTVLLMGGQINSVIFRAAPAQQRPVSVKMT